MKNKRRTLGLLALLIVVAATLVWYRFTPGEVPRGQPRLVTLDTTYFQTLRADFNHDVDKTRLIVLLSPT